MLQTHPQPPGRLGPVELREYMASVHARADEARLQAELQRCRCEDAGRRGGDLERLVTVPRLTARRAGEAHRDYADSTRSGKVLRPARRIGWAHRPAAAIRSHAGI